MTSALKSGTDVAAALAAETARLLWSLARELAWSCAVRSLVRLPLALLACTALTLLVASIPTALVLRGGDAAAPPVALLSLLGLSATAGLVWGMHWTVHRGVIAFLAALDRPMASAIDALLAPLVWLGDARVGAVAIEDVRRACCPAMSTLPAHIPGIPKWRWLQAMTRLALRWLLAAELAVLDRVLVSLERRGETHVSPRTLQGVVRDELLAQVRAVAHVHLRQFDWLAAAAVLMLLVVPAAAFCWIQA